MANLSGNLREAGVTAVNTGYAVTMANHNSVLDVTATGGAVAVTLPSASTVGNGFHVVIQRNTASDSNVTVGAPVSATLTASDSVRELYSDGSNWLTVSRGSISAHASTHASAGSDPISPSSIGAASTTHASTHADGGTDEVRPLAIGAPSLHGFENRTSSTLGMSSDKLQVTTSGGGYSYWIAGTKYTKTTTQEVTISTDNTLHFVYYTAAGLQVATAPWDIMDLTAIPVATVYKTGSSYAVADERHSYLRNLTAHEWAHTTIFARWRSGFAATFNNTSFSIAIGIVADEDIQASSGGTKTACRLWYRNSGAASMTFESNIAYPWKNNSGPKYDNAGTLTAVGANKFFNSWVYATTDVDYPIYIVVGQAAHNTIALARNEAQPTIPLTTAEWKLLYRATYQESSGSATYVEAADYRQVSTGPATGGYTPTSHLGLTDIGANTHATIDSHIASTSNPHSVTAAQVGAYYSGGTDVAVADGGTGASTLASNGVLYGNGTSAVQALAVNSTATRKYLSQVSSGAPTWETVTASGASRYRLRRGV